MAIYHIVLFFDGANGQKRRGVVDYRNLASMWTQRFLTGVVISVQNLGFKSLRYIAEIGNLTHSRFVEGIKGFTPVTNTPTFWIAFQIKKRGLLTSTYALCSIGQSKQ